MGWADSVKATALRVLAERKTTTGRAPADSLWTWNPYDVWLSRARPARDAAAQPAENEPVTQPRPNIAPRD